jgi:resuscitation-promoting factor RpfB
MKRLLPLASMAAVFLAACGSGADAPPRHIVAVAPNQPSAPAVERTIVTLPPITADRPAPAPRASRAAAPRSRAVPATGDVWAALARCESGGNAQAVSRSGKYFGAFQFSLATWQSLGYSGRPTDHPYATQLQAAQKLQARSGWGQWPVCARKLGLR